MHPGLPCGMRSESRPFGALTPQTDWHRNGCPFQCIDFCSLRVQLGAARTGFWLSLFRFQGATRCEHAPQTRRRCPVTTGKGYGGSRTSSARSRPTGSRPVSADATWLRRGYPARERRITIWKPHPGVKRLLPCQPPVGAAWGTPRLGHAPARPAWARSPWARSALTPAPGHAPRWTRPRPAVASGHPRAPSGPSGAGEPRGDRDPGAPGTPGAHGELDPGG